VCHTLQKMLYMLWRVGLQHLGIYMYRGWASLVTQVSPSLFHLP
jgi:hypothetical protein